MTNTKTPAGFGREGRRFWKEIDEKYDFSPAEKRLLQEASRVIDVIERLTEAMDGEPLVVRGSAGQAREHPLLSEQRQQRALLARLLHQLRVPESDSLGAVREDELSRKRRAAVRTRYAS